MTNEDMKETTDVEKALIHLVKIALQKKTRAAIFSECMSNAGFQRDLVEAFKDFDGVIGELSGLTLGKVVLLVKAAIEEIAAPTLV